MNADQKQRIAQAVSNWRSYDLQEAETVTENELSAMCSSMAALLQELIEAPEVDPVATVTGYYGGHLSISTIDGRVLPAGTALYLAPPAPSVPDGWRGLTDVEWMNIVNFDRAYSSYDKEGAVNEAVKRTEAKLKELNAAQQQEPPADLVQRLIDGGPQLFPETNHVYRVKNMAIYLWRQYLESERDKLKGQS